MATIMDIFKKIITKYPSITKLSYIPTKLNGELNNKRDKAYRYFLKKEFPNARFSVRQGDGGSPIIDTYNKEMV
jgi:hypothetical protein